METDTNDVTNDFILGISFYKTNYISFNYKKNIVNNEISSSIIVNIITIMKKI